MCYELEGNNQDGNYLEEEDDTSDVQNCHDGQYESDGSEDQDERLYEDQEDFDNLYESDEEFQDNYDCEHETSHGHRESDTYFDY